MYCLLHENLLYKHIELLQLVIGVVCVKILERSCIAVTQQTVTMLSNMYLLTSRGGKVLIAPQHLP